MLIYSMGVSLDGFISDRAGDFQWSVPSTELFDFHLERVGTLGATILGRRLYETMLIWETDPSFPETAAEKEFARIWAALPKIVFSRTLTHVEGNARLATRSLGEEIAATRAATEMDIEIGGATLAAQALEAGLLDDLQLFRYPVIVGGGTPLIPPVTQKVSLRLIEARTFGNDVVFEHYRIRR